MSGHERLSPSSAHRWMACPGSATHTAGMSSRETPAMKDGTAAHWLAEQILKSELEGLGVAPNGVKITEAMRKHVSVYTDRCKARIADCDEYWIESAAKATFLDDEIGGTADFIAIKGRTLYVDDYKHGQGHYVSPINNPQGMLYALGALPVVGIENVDTVEITIVQPRCAIGHGVETWVISVDDLLDEGLAFRAGAIATRDPDAPRKAGKHCKFCPGKLTCDVFQVAALAAAEADFGAVDLPPSPEPAAVAAAVAMVENGLPILPTLSADDMGARLAAVPLLKMWIEAVKEYALAEAEAGRVPTGFKVEAGREGAREWRANPAKELDALATQLKIDVRELYINKPSTPTGVESVVGKKVFASFSKGLVTRSPGKPTLKPLGQERDDFSAFAD